MPPHPFGSTAVVCSASLSLSCIVFAVVCSFLSPIVPRSFDGKQPIFRCFVSREREREQLKG